jgi:hypothetical protein
MQDDPQFKLSKGEILICEPMHWAWAREGRRVEEPLDAFERAMLFALQRALRRDREEAARRTMRLVERTERRGGSAA